MFHKLIEIWQNISRKKKLEAKISEGLDSMQLDKEHELLLRAISLQMKSALTGIIGASDLLRENGDEQQNPKFMQIIEHSAKKLVVLADEIEHISREKKFSAEHGEMCSLPEELQELASFIKEESLLNKFDITVNIDNDLPKKAFLCASFLHQLVMHLLDSIMCMHIGKNITMNFNNAKNAEGSCLWIEIDGFIPRRMPTSNAINADHKHSDNAEEGWNGLALCRRLLSLYQAQLELRRTKKGFDLLVKIPLKHQKSIITTEESKVLLVEDNMVNALVLSKMLRKNDCKVMHVTTASQALSAVSLESYDLVLLDLILPDENGQKLTPKLLKKSQGLYIVGMSVSAQPGLKSECLQTGMVDFIRKPIPMKKLKLVLSEAKGLSSTKNLNKPDDIDSMAQGF